MSLNYRYICIVLPYLLSLLIIAPVWSETFVLEEIVITAQKREQNLQDVGIAVSAFSSEQLRQLGLTNSVDLTSQIPNAEILSPIGSGQNANLVIRGVGLNDFNNGNEAPVTAYIDEFYLVSLSVIDFLMYDLERVEVLKGPQGTLFGRNSNGGLFHFITAKPSESYESYVEASLADFGQQELEAAVSGLLTEGMRGRLSASWMQTDGYVEAQVPGVADGDQRDIVSVRGQLEVDFANNGQVWLKLEHSELDNILPPYGHKATFVDPATGLEQFSTGLENGVCSGCDVFGFSADQLGADDRNKHTAGDNPTVETDSDLVQVNVSWAFDAFDLISITAWMDIEKRYLDRDLDANPITGVGDHNQFATTPYETDYITQELRLSGGFDKSRWTLGFYYMDQDAREHGFANLLGDGVGSFAVQGMFDWDQQAKSTALFGHYEYDIAQTLTLIAGARYSLEEKEFDMVYRSKDPANIFGFGALATFTALAPFPYNRDTVGSLAEVDDELFTAKLELDWRPYDGGLLYASYSRGQKVGGFNNGQVPIILKDEVRFDEETVDAYELGLKTKLLRGRARMNTALFYYDYLDFQNFSFAGLGSVTGNNDATLLGAEIEFVVSPLDGLDISFGASALDTEVEDVSSGVLVRDREMAMAPEFTANGLMRYQWPVWQGHLAAQVDFVHSKERWSAAVNHPTMEMEEYTQGNLRLSFTPDSDQWLLAFWIRNFNNSEHTVTAFPLAATFGLSQYLYNPPRQVGITLNLFWK